MHPWRKSLGLDWYPIEYEICDYKEMIGHMAYTGMPTHYRHWSYGKSFDRIQTEYDLGHVWFTIRNDY
jgi:stage V sporulation protein R